MPAPDPTPPLQPPCPAAVLGALAVLGLVSPIVTAVAPLGQVPVLIVALVLMLAGRRHFPHLMGGMALPLALLVLWACLSTVWSDEPRLAINAAIRTAGVALAGLTLTRLVTLLPTDMGRRFGTFLLTGCGIAAAILLTEYLSDHLISALIGKLKGEPVLPANTFKSQLNRGAAMVAVYAWPLIVVVSLRGGNVWAAVAWGAMGAIALLSENLSSLMAFTAGSLVFASLRLAPQAVLTALRALLVLAILAVPALALAIPSPQDTLDWHLPSSAHHRLTILSFAAGKLAEKPFLGWGMDASRNIEGGNEVVEIEVQGPTGTYRLKEQVMPLHPHNAVMQIWLELGALGAIILLLLVWQSVSAIKKQETITAQSMMAATFISFFVVSCFSFGAWQHWWLATGWVATAACLVIREFLSAKQVCC